MIGEGWPIGEIGDEVECRLARHVDRDLGADGAHRADSMRLPGRFGRSPPTTGEAVWMDEFEPCSICARTLLIGEGVTMLGDAARAASVCDLCLGRPRAAALGEPLRRERVHSRAGAETVSTVLLAPRQAVQEVPTDLAAVAASSAT